MKKKLLWAVCIVLLIATVAVLVTSVYLEKRDASGYDDGIEMIDPNTIKLGDTKTRVSFGEVILSKPQETRKLVVFEQDAKVSATVEQRIIDHIDWKEMTKTQTVSYAATGSFVVDLDGLKEEDIMDDSESKTLTIKVPHPHLDKIEVDPNKIMIGDTEKGFFAFGKLTLTLDDYNAIEQNIQKRFKETLDTSANGQDADDKALRMVKEIYEPVILAIDPDYTVIVEFK